MLTAVRKYYSRVLLLFILLVFVGCTKECEEKRTPNYTACETSGTVILTSTNPSVSAITAEDAVIEKGAVASVNYWYEYMEDSSDVDTMGKPKAVPKSITPPVKVTFSVMARGTHTVKEKTSALAGGVGGGRVYIGTYADSPIPEGELATEGLFKLTITLQQPKITNPKLPNISMPFIGPIIGPETKPTVVKYVINYWVELKEEYKDPLF
jgi:hypothetical protein